LHIGIIGTGSIVETFIDAANMLSGITITAIYSRNNESDRVNSLADKYQIPLIYDDLDLMLQNPKIDFIYIASPNSLHYPQSLKALEAGKHVICEKPFTSTAKEAAHLLDVAKAKGLMLFEGIATIHMPNFRLIQENLHKIGTLRIIQLNYSQYSSRYDAFLTGQTPNVFNPAFSGGCLQDINIYNVHFMLAMFGQPRDYTYFPNLHENGIDTSGVLIMQYPGFTAALTGAKDTYSENFAYIQGEKGYIHVKNGAHGCSEIHIDIRGEESCILNLQPEKNRLFYELEVFRRISTQKDFETCYKLAQYSVDVVRLVENARKKAGVYFAADHD